MFPNLSLQGQITKPEFYSKAEFITGIQKWVDEYPDAAALMFLKASETVDEWRSAVDGYGKSHAAYPRILARAKSLKQENLVKKLELLTQATDEMIKIAQGKWNSPDKDNPERLQNFTTVRNKAVDYAVAIYEILVVEIANL